MRNRHIGDKGSTFLGDRNVSDQRILEIACGTAYPLCRVHIDFSTEDVTHFLIMTNFLRNDDNRNVRADLFVEDFYLVIFWGDGFI